MRRFILSHLTILFLTFFSIELWANNTPSNLNELDQYLNAKPLAVAFPLNHTATIKLNSCVRTICDAFTVQQTITANDSHVAEISTFNNAGKKTSIQKITATRWDEMYGNRIRFLIAELNSFGFAVTLDFLGEENFSLLQSEKTITVPALRVLLHAENQIGNKEKITALVSPELQGLDQLVYKKIERTLGTEEFTLKSVSN